MERIDYDERQHMVYSTGRALSPESAALWSQVFARWSPPARPLTALDLGSGTGRFTAILADTLGGPAIGVEPSERMRAQAPPHPGVQYLAGGAEALPLPDASCDVVLMFLVLHHVVDRAAAAVEIRRVLRPGGRLLVRSTFADRMPDLLWHRYFPSARRIELEMFPTVAEVTDLFAAAGLSAVGHERVRETTAPDFAAYVRRLRLRAISTFEHLPEDEIERGFAALDAEAAAGGVPGPIMSESDLLVIEAPS